MANGDLTEGMGPISTADSDVGQIYWSDVCIRINKRIYICIYIYIYVYVYIYICVYTDDIYIYTYVSI